MHTLLANTPNDLINKYTLMHKVCVEIGPSPSLESFIASTMPEVYELAACESIGETIGKIIDSIIKWFTELPGKLLIFLRNIFKLNDIKLKTTKIQLDKLQRSPKVKTIFDNIVIPNMIEHSDLKNTTESLKFVLDTFNRVSVSETEKFMYKELFPADQLTHKTLVDNHHSYIELMNRKYKPIMDEGLFITTEMFKHANNIGCEIQYNNVEVTSDGMKSATPNSKVSSHEYDTFYYKQIFFVKVRTLLPTEASNKKTLAEQGFGFKEISNLFDIVNSSIKSSSSSLFTKQAEMQSLSNRTKEFANWMKKENNNNRPTNDGIPNYVNLLQPFINSISTYIQSINTVLEVTTQLINVISQLTLSVGQEDS